MNPGTQTAQILGHARLGDGPRGVVVMNDWMCDTSTWDGARAYLDGARFSFAFADLRGYGRSRGRPGAFDVLEAAGDILALADALAWRRFAVVGHSMSTLVALHLAQQRPDRVTRAVLLTPPPPAGFGADDDALARTQALARSPAPARAEALAARFAERLGSGWAAFKAARWEETADRDAVAAYARMFMQDGLPDKTTQVRVPVLAITGEQDAPPLRRDATVESLTPLCNDLTVTPLADAGHYPMQEMPPLTAVLVERFLALGDA